VIEKTLETNVLEKSIFDIIRSYINQRLAASYSLNIRDITIDGLSEVIDLSKTVDTLAKEKLNFLLNHMPGGSIGISGTRGAGKSILIRTYCGDRRSISKIKEREIFPIMASVPVKYDFREFLLYLFGTTFEKLLDKRKSLRDINQFTLSQEANAPISIFKQIIHYTRIYSLHLGTLLIFLSLALQDIHSNNDSKVLKTQELKYRKIIDSLGHNLSTKAHDSVLNYNVYSSKKNALETIDRFQDSLYHTLDKIDQPKKSFQEYYIASIDADTPARLATYGIVSFAILTFFVLFNGFLPLSTVLTLGNQELNQKGNTGGNNNKKMRNKPMEF